MFLQFKNVFYAKSDHCLAFRPLGPDFIRIPIGSSWSRISNFMIKHFPHLTPAKTAVPRFIVGVRCPCRQEQCRDTGHDCGFHCPSFICWHGTPLKNITSMSSVSLKLRTSPSPQTETWPRIT